jgi:homoserine dehydrogenase
LAEAKRLGYAEPDPTNDVNGADSASKLAILATLAFRRSVLPTDIETEGIAGLTLEDFEAAARFGYTIKLTAVAEAFGDPGSDDLQIGLQVFPALVNLTHPLAQITGTTNAVSIVGLASEELILSGPGAGRLPSAAAILGDVLTAGEHLKHEIHRPLLVGPRAKVRPTRKLLHAFYIRVRVVDAPGVLAEVAGILGRHGVSVKSLIQEGRGADASIIFITHATVEGALRDAIKEFEGLPSVHGQPQVTRILDA